MAGPLLLLTIPVNYSRILRQCVLHQMIRKRKVLFVLLAADPLSLVLLTSSRVCYGVCD